MSTPPAGAGGHWAAWMEPAPHCVTIRKNLGTVEEVSLPPEVLFCGGGKRASFSERDRQSTVFGSSTRRFLEKEKGRMGSRFNSHREDWCEEGSPTFDRIFVKPLPLPPYSTKTIFFMIIMSHQECPRRQREGEGGEKEFLRSNDPFAKEGCFH